MKSVLHKFITEPLFDATEAMLSHLHIKFTAQSKTPLSFAELYSDTVSSSMPQALQQVADKISCTYLIGSIDEDTLEGRRSDFDLLKPTDGKYDTMVVFAVDIKPGVTLTRGELATLTRGFNRLAAALPVVVFIRSGQYLSLATCERSEFRQNWRDGERLGKVSILRDINCANPHRGHCDILSSLGDKAYPTFDDLYKHWLDVFSSELLTRKFYTELSEWYAWVISSGEVKFPNDITTTDDDTKFNHEAVIRLITRLIFVWFLKQKHLIPNEFFDEGFIREHFIENFDPHSTNSIFYNPKESKYFRLILQNLFFAMLNRPICDEASGKGENRRFADHSKKFQGKSPDFGINNLLRYRSEFKEGGADLLLEIANSHVPFLNGGLFECLDDKENKFYIDGFSEHTASLEQLAFPDYFFFGDEVGHDVDLSGWYDDKKKNRVHVHSLINILNHYNFTVEENTPLDQEVSLDPELLGKVFENLLASYNPETNTTARKQTGSFYTPREIVQYMVTESLTAHLKHTCPAIDESVFRNLFDYSVDNFEAPGADRKAIMSALYNCKVLDPACGSGAFPMGILQQMVHALRKLDPTNEMWKEFILEISLKKDKEAYLVEDEEERSRLRADIEQSFNRQVNDPDYARKLYIIENCIYGVDIQPIAVQISKLRFFISLVADQKPKYTEPNINFGIRPLPNLEAKFVSANTLIPLEKESNLFGSSDELEKIKKRLSEANHKIFRVQNNREKKLLRQIIDDLRKKYSEELVSMGSIGPSSAQKLASWNMFNQNSAAQFFDPEWMFGITDGFDIVIGNPPYIQLQKSIGIKKLDKRGHEYEEKLGDLYDNGSFKTFAKTGDIYCLFYELGTKLLKPDGHLCFITSNKWMRAGYGEKIRSFFANETNPKILIDFGGVQVFASATVDTNILLLSKGKNLGKTKAVTIGKEAQIGALNLSDYIKQSPELSFCKSGSWVILSPIEESIKRKIESVGVPLKDWDISIYRGVLTGYNEAFIISTEKKNEILSNCKTEEERRRTEELIRPILRGRDIKRYGYVKNELWLIATFPSRHYDIELYPAVKEHLLSFGMERLEQTGKEYVINGEKIKARKKTNNKWFETQDSISYWEDFSRPKIMYMEIQTDNEKDGYPFPCFSYDEENRVVLNTAYILCSKSVDVRFILGVINSRLGRFLTKIYVSQLQERQYRMLAQYVANFPIPRLSPNEMDFIIELVNSNVHHNSKEIEDRINRAVYSWYNLNAEELEFLEQGRL